MGVSGVFGGGGGGGPSPDGNNMIAWTFDVQ